MPQLTLPTTKISLHLPTSVCASINSPDSQYFSWSQTACRDFFSLKYWFLLNFTISSHYHHTIIAKSSHWPHTIITDGVHVGQSDMSAAEVRRLIGPDMILGVSTKSCAEALQAQADGADYVGTGAVYPTNTKVSTHFIWFIPFIRFICLICLLTFLSFLVVPPLFLPL